MRFTCSCGKKLRVKNGKPGMKVRCPGCREVSVLGAPPAEARPRTTRMPAARRTLRTPTTELPGAPRRAPGALLGAGNLGALGSVSAGGQRKKIAPKVQPEKTEHGEMIFSVASILSPKKCQSLILVSERYGFEKAEADLDIGSQRFDGVRDAYTVQCEQPRWAASLWKQLQPFIPEYHGLKASRIGQQFTFYRYIKGQSFGWHKDRQKVGAFQEKSWLSLMIYLNDNFTGGGTRFMESVVPPVQGTALLYPHDVPHQGVAVLQGTKYVLRSDVFFADPAGTMDATLRGY